MELAQVSGNPAKNGPDCYVSPFELKAPTGAARALQCLFPPRTPRSRLLSFFAERAALETIRCWRSGRHKPPQWALDMLREHARQIEACVDATEAGNAARIGTEALRRYRLEKKSRQLDAADRFQR